MWSIRLSGAGVIRRLVLVGLASVALVGCFHKNVPTLQIPTDSPTPTSDDSLLSAAAGDLTDGLTKEFRDAQALAKVWRADAELYAHTVSVPPNLARNRAKRVYVFGSAATASEWWTITVNEQTGERVRSLIPREDYLGPTLQAAPLQYWKLNYVQALQIADVGDGQAFREANPGAEVTVSLVRGEPKNWLWWTVSYRGLNNQTLSVRVHPSSGEIYGDDGQPVETASPSPTAG